jgi:hypothetical protein
MLIALNRIESFIIMVHRLCPLPLSIPACVAGPAVPFIVPLFIGQKVNPLALEGSRIISRKKSTIFEFR